MTSLLSHWVRQGIAAMMVRNQSLVVGCVADNNRKYLDQALRLLQSWRWFAGKVAGTDFYVCVVECIDEQDQRLFESFGAKVRIVERFDARHPPSNKLRFLLLPELQRYDQVLLLDCDTVVVRDPSPLLDKLRAVDFAAKIADLATVPHETFETLFTSFGVRIPERNFRCTVGGDKTIPYFNAGVLAFSKRATKVLVPEWVRLNKELIGDLDRLGTQGNFCEQASLSLALVKSGLEFSAVGNEFNFPAHLTDGCRDPKYVQVDPFIIHYHWLIDEHGYLAESVCPNVNERIKIFNDRLRRERRANFDNRAFWNKRYIEDPERGSGRGSRGEALAYKRQLLDLVRKRHSASTVLDVGCGDMETGSIFPDQGYTGVDVSDVIVQQNRERFPHRKFVCGDIRTLSLTQADLVVCLDVLIHTPRADAYHKSVKCLVELVNKAGIVSGYDEEPKARSEITYFHQPISETLRHVGATNIRKIGSYRQVAVYEFEAAMAAPRRVIAKKPILTNPLFLVGTMRSGTTILAELLDQHPDVCYCKFELKDIWSTAGVAMASPKTHDLDCRELGVAQATPAIREELMRAFVERLSSYGEKNPGAIFLNKNPHLCNKLPFVRGLFPDSRFIWAHRNLLRVVASIKRLFAAVNSRQTTWHYWPEPSVDTLNRCWHARFALDDVKTLDPARVFPGGNARYIAEYWLESNRAVSRFFAGIHSSNWLEVVEEDLIANPEIELGRCLGFLELPLSLPYEKLKSLDSQRNHEWHDLLDRSELQELESFIRERARDIDGIHSGIRLSQTYLEEISSALARKGGNS